VPDEVRATRLTVLEIRSSNPPPDDQCRKPFEKGLKDRYSNSLLGDVPQSPTRFSTQKPQVAVQSMFGVRLACLIPFTDSTPKYKA